MSPIQKFSSTFIALATLNNCVGPYIQTHIMGSRQVITASYVAPLIKVERPADVRKRYGNIETITMGDSSQFHFEDSLISSFLWLSSEEVNFRIFNKSDHTMKLIWDDAAFIETDNSASRVMHLGVKYSERNESMPASIIPRHGKIEDLATPTNRISWSEGNEFRSGSWKDDEIFVPGTKVLTGDSSGVPHQLVDMYKVAAQKHIGEKVGLILPLEIEGVKNEYTFWFQVQKVEIDTTSAVQIDSI